MSNRFPTDAELMAHIRKCAEEYHGDSERLNAAAGLLVLGRVYGWEHQRIVSGRRAWTLASRVFGDPKEMLPKRTPIALKKSRALKVVDALTSAGKLVSGYLDVVRGHVAIEKDDKRMVD